MEKKLIFVMKTSMEKKLLYFKRINKRGVSAVVATLMLVLLTLVLVGILWTVIGGMVEGELENTNCLGTLQKVVLNDQYICYNQTSSELEFSIGIADIDVDKVIVSISGAGQTRSIELTNDDQNIPHVRPYGGALTDPVKLPEKNGGLTYIYDMGSAGFAGTPDSIKIAPIIGTNQCEVTDSILEIVSCASYS